eukprot:TRINITY_DN39818_c0_g2_i1.p1 TRINITY_DN39818_c0_g2~~TRINITY_DN39818_c0_g2_i1.p1  ORF type:complete len:777 (-),score=162.47 TRINITY_DN39818_c0_g2_i1:152-2482(-)
MVAMRLCLARRATWHGFLGPRRHWQPRNSVRATASLSGLAEKRSAALEAGRLDELPEVRQRAIFRDELAAGSCGSHRTAQPGQLTFADAGLRPEQVEMLLDVGLATFLLHVEARIANQVGEGFYTIGPGGEESLAAVGLALRSDDPAALHYRHLATTLARALQSGKDMEQVLLDRARGYCISKLDPVSGGMHCCLGGEKSDFIVTSTLASQSTPAVGRAAGLRLAKFLGVDSPMPTDAVSYVSLGEGSVNNAHFLSAVNLSEYMAHRGFQCPVVFGMSDNGQCISLRSYGWTPKFLEQRVGMKVFTADGNSLAEVYKATSDALSYARKRRSPALVYFHSLSRRFGHAGTDRQDAYLTADEIRDAEARNALAGACAQAVDEGVTTYEKLSGRFEELREMIEVAFNKAAAEPKVSSANMSIELNARPTVSKREWWARPATADLEHQKRGGENPKVMRSNMTRVLDEQLQQRKNLVYIGEDVQHGGYYKITEGLHSKYSLRVADFPPDETSLIGVGMGYSQAGLLPIVEIPYAKYLDCGGDMFYEACLMNWVSAGKQPAGMLVRMQGFDKGVFGGNFHTHNSLTIPPGLDLVVYSNGADYVRGMRYALEQAAAGRLVMSVDSTDLLNRRHLFDKDGAWMRPYPSDVNEVMSFDEVRTYGGGTKLAIVSYGNGVPLALGAQKQLQEEHGIDKVTVIDAPYLSRVPGDLKTMLPAYKAVVFADVCKFGQHPHAGWITSLQAEGLLPAKWRSVGAANTYNPLGQTVTFLQEADILQAALSVV